MCALSSDLNAFASVGVEDIYRRAAAGFDRPPPSARGQVHRDRVRPALHRDGAGAVAHADGRAVAVVFRFGHRQRRSRGAFHAGVSEPSAPTARGVYAGIVACVAFTGWATLTLGDEAAPRPRPLQLPVARLHDRRDRERGAVRGRVCGEPAIRACGVEGGAGRAVGHRGAPRRVPPPV